MRQISTVLFLISALAGSRVRAAAADEGAPLLFRNPTVSETQIVFEFAGDLWKVTREGGDATRLTAGEGYETLPRFSPDGTKVAFSGEYQGNLDVYVAPSEGGVPERLTYHPDADLVRGWSPDGRILFHSKRDTPTTRYGLLYAISTGGGPPEILPLPRVFDGALSPDAKRLAYMPFSRMGGNVAAPWKNYRGGTTTPVWIADLSDSSITRVPRENSNDSEPMWFDGKVYFLSDRNGLVTLFSFDPRSGRLKEEIKGEGFDIYSASAGPDAIVFERFGRLGLHYPKNGKTEMVDIRLRGDLAEVRPRFEKAAKFIRAAAVSPTGKRVAFEARGEILTVPAEKGDSRNVSSSPGAHERSPAWSPDGQSIAYFSDASGEYELFIRSQNGIGEPERIRLDQNPGFYSSLEWSPDGKKLVYTDNRVNLLFFDRESGKSTKVDTDTYYDPLSLQHLDPVWSPDSRWIAYTKKLPNRLRALFIYSLEEKQARQVSDGLSDALFAAWDKDSKHLYFTASTDSGFTNAWLDMSSTQRPVTRSVYVVVLRRDLPSPIAPESDDEKKPDDAAKEKKEDGDAAKDDSAAKKDVEPFRIDFEGIDQRILALPIPARNYSSLQAGEEGVLFLTDAGLVAGSSDGATVYRFNLKDRKTDKFLEEVRGIWLSRDGKKLLHRKKDDWTLVDSKEPPKDASKGKLEIASLQVRVDPRQEWGQMYHEVWRIQREFFYDPNLHGANWKELSERYQPYVSGVGSRRDLNYLFAEMLSPMSVGHLYIGGGEIPEPDQPAAGLLGADFEVENGRFRFSRVYSGENWNPDLQAPLTKPGVNVRVGEYLLAVNGREVTTDREVHAFFEATAEKQTVLRVSGVADGTGARDVIVVPVKDDRGLRHRAWVEDNRRLVNERTGGRVAYVYLPNTANAGLTYFNRYFAAQSDREAVIIDERFNGGGLAADYIVDALNRPLMSHWTTRYGEDFNTPGVAVFGPKVMIIDQFAGSGGDLLPWLFRRKKLGTLVGKRTWGGLVGILGFPPLMDGGAVTSPNLAFWNPEGEWEVENHGVAPDIEVEFDPALVRQGRDPQLDKAIEVILEELKNNPPKKAPRPSYPDYSLGGR